MTGPEDTSRRHPAQHLLGLLGDHEGYITGMEAAGQRQLVASQALPAHGPWDELTELGFVKGDAVDDLFVTAQLPAGWSKEGSDHAMHSYIVDERGVRRVNVFYKAAYYDRKADMHLMNPGYSAGVDALYGDEAPALPAHWSVFTADERAEFLSWLDGMDTHIRETPDVYGKHAERLAAIRALLADRQAAKGQSR